MNGEKKFPKRVAFKVRHRVDISVDLDFALALGNTLLEHHCSNPAIVAFAHQLQNLAPTGKGQQDKGGDEQQEDYDEDDDEDDQRSFRSLYK